MTVHDLQNEIRQQVKAVIMIALAALAFAALIFPGQTGEVGMFFNNVLRMLFGEISVVLPGLCIVVGLQEILPWKITNIRQRKAGIMLLTFILLVYVHLQVMENHLNLVMDLRFYKASWLLGVQQQGGGVFGAVFAMMLYFLFRDIGSYIVLLALGIIAFLLITHISLIQLIRSACRLLSVLLRLLWCGLKKTGSALKYILFSEPNTAGPEKEDDEEDDEPASFTGRHIKTDSSPQKQDPPLTLFSLDKPETTTKLAPVIPFPSHDKHVHEPAEKPAQPALHTVATHPDKDTLDSADMFPAVTLPAEPNEYMLPPLKILAKMPKQRDTQAQKTLVERAKILERTLESFGVRARVTDAQAGPTVTRFELQPEIGVKVSKIVALSDDLALNLAASDVRIEAPIPGKAAVGIEVPNKVIAPVYLREVLEDEQFQNAASALTIALGKDITGNPILADLMKMPHLLIAGSTGSGKSVCINILIASILFRSRPDEVKFVMIDPKVVELSNFNGIPHLLMPVVTDAKRASLALKNMLKEMTHRYEIFAKEGVRDIHSFNERKRQQNDVTQLLPFIVVIIDELADLMMVAAADVEDSIARLAQMSRAAGIHLVIATQRPSVDVITGVIKANITSRIAFAVSSQADSRTILDMGGAEKLLGRGDALFHPIGLPKPFRIQGAFINERELGQLLEFIKNQGEPEFSEHLLPEDNQDDDFYEEDDLFPEAVMLFAEAGTASISLLQRRLRIGYTRAARLVDDMERRGFVGQFEGSKAREILITPDQAKKLLFDRDH